MANKESPLKQKKKTEAMNLQKKQERMYEALERG